MFPRSNCHILIEFNCERSFYFKFLMHAGGIVFEKKQRQELGPEYFIIDYFLIKTQNIKRTEGWMGIDLINGLNLC